MSIRYSFLIGGTVSAAMLAMGCNSSSKPAQPGQQQAQQNAPAWTLTLKAQCAESTEQCLAHYGFSVDAEGNYQVGPGPQGQVRKGKLSDSDFQAVKAQVEAVGSMQLAASENHEALSAEDATANNETLTLARKGAATHVLVRNEGTDFATILSDAKAAHTLQAAIHDLAKGYYRMPFGDACGDAADQFAAAVAQDQNCNVDTDCQYFNSVTYADGTVSAQPVDLGVESWITSENCLATAPVIVGNAAKIGNDADKLSSLSIAATNACGGEFVLNNAFTEAQQGGQYCEPKQVSTAKAATCEQHVCRAHF
jgi:hypothetical protein